MPKLVVSIATAIAFLAAPELALSAPQNARDINVHVTRDGPTFAIEGEWSVGANGDEVWAVLTDFEHMARFLSSVDASRIVSREGNRLEIVQKSHANAGLLRLSLENTRAIVLTPKRGIESHLLKGDLKASDFTTRIVDDAGGSKIIIRGQFVVSGLASAAVNVESVEVQTRLSYQEMRDEILRRKSNEPTPACLLAKNCP
jgi:carbon monoxide dehydrogenase subunit G